MPLWADSSIEFSRIEGGPGTKITTAPPAVPAGHNIGAGSILKIAVLFSIEPPLGKISVDKRKAVQIMVEYEFSCIFYLTVFSKPDTGL